MSDEDYKLRVSLERHLARGVRYRRLSRALMSAQAALRKRVSDDVWRLYLVIEERANARHGAIVDAAIRVARRAGRRR